MKYILFFITLFISLAGFSANLCQQGAEGLQALPAAKCLEEPICFERKAEETNEGLMIGAAVSDVEILSRLVYAESLSTNFQNNPTACAPIETIFDKIALGVMSRVHQGSKFGSGVKGVIFKKAQFNPAISKKSEYSQYFICPQKAGKGWEKNWFLAVKAAEAALKIPKHQNEFFKKGINHFYYPLSKQATTPPMDWADLSKPKAQKAFIKEESSACVQFFRY